MKRKRVLLQLILIISLMLFVLNQTNAEEIKEASMRVRILETTDLHARIIGYDYKNRKSSNEFGLAKTASLIAKARQEEPNVLLFDTGDAIVGNALDEYVWKTKYMDFHTVHPVYKAMNLLNYDAATVGNHEFNHGLDFLKRSIEGAQFPFVNANIYLDGENENGIDEFNYFNPFIILERTFIDNNGKRQKLKVGVIGFVTPITAEWDKQYFQGNLKIKNIKETAQHFVPIMKNMGTDIVIALAHVGLEPDKGLKEQEGNSVNALSEVEGIDAILYGHTHLLFPDKNSIGSKEINNGLGTINGIPAVQAGFWGNHLGIIDLDLQKENGKWEVMSSQSMNRPIYHQNKNTFIPLVHEDQRIIESVKLLHQETLKYLNK
ncbi:metallophosphoesterase [Bacillus sp. S/N-304-OC-R1]|uniref:metallophosphoesterase n=1 Tax=Bacillus sp. S/N-304-OC-R1 TaxID=2758034 RepID=UPI001C8DE240|nr:metallophosphoesterase [Bacillus sp. S/N-304-OC-R1]MBY0120338.1 metallophosphoesterase [Bacillus sp. S/N-304-OC-R1]